MVNFLCQSSDDRYSNLLELNFVVPEMTNRKGKDLLNQDAFR